MAGLIAGLRSVAAVIVSLAGSEVSSSAGTPLNPGCGGWMKRVSTAPIT